MGVFQSNVFQNNVFQGPHGVVVAPEGPPPTHVVSGGGSRVSARSLSSGLLLHVGVRPGNDSPRIDTDSATIRIDSEIAIDATSLPRITRVR